MREWLPSKALEFFAWGKARGFMVIRRIQRDQRGDHRRTVFSGESEGWASWEWARDVIG